MRDRHTQRSVEGIRVVWKLTSHQILQGLALQTTNKINIIIRLVWVTRSLDVPTVYSTPSG